MRAALPRHASFTFNSSYGAPLPSRPSPPCNHQHQARLSSHGSAATLRTCKLDAIAAAFVDSPSISSARPSRKWRAIPVHPGDKQLACKSKDAWKCFSFMFSDGQQTPHSRKRSLPSTSNAPCTEESSSCNSNPRGKKGEQWLEDAVVEIVRNLQEAPFLQLVFNSKGCTRTERQRVSQRLFSNEVDTRVGRDNSTWTTVKDSLSSMAPDGVILVQHLNGDACASFCATRDSEHYTGASGSTDLWGLLYLEKSSATSACYILKTNRVVTCSGICTRFNLVKAQCFGPPAYKQIENSCFHLQCGNAKPQFRTLHFLGSFYSEV